MSTATTAAEGCGTPWRSETPFTGIVFAFFATCAFCLSSIGAAASGPTSAGEAKAFEGTPTQWHDGFARYDFVMDEQSLAITPFTAPAGEKFGIGAPAKGQRRCVVVVPKSPAPGNPWSWRGCYWDHQPQAEVELLRCGFHVAYISADAVLKPGKEWDAWYAFLTDGHGLSKKPAFVGMSRGGEYAYTWATDHPDEVSCIYADNPGGNRGIFTKLIGLADNDVPLLHVCGSIDPLLGKNSNAIEGIYQQLGGRISVMIKEGAGHHPHSLRNPKPIADFIVQSVESSAAVEPPAFVGQKFTRSSYYGIDNAYIDFPEEGTHITCRGPFFSGCYNRYAFELPGVEGTINVIEPKAAAPGKPWVFRAGFASRDATVDLALLAKGFHIVTGPVPYNADGPTLPGWNAVYKHLVDHELSKRPVMEGAGAAAGEVYAWAIANPDKVSCIYGENPILHSHMSKGSLIENLAPLAQAGVPILHICGSLDPALDENTKAVQQKYQALGGQMKVIVIEGAGHYPTSPKDPQTAVDFIVARQK
jgi:pimeloyl-ACP methyl ester carboxylesterase